MPALLLLPPFALVPPSGAAPLALRHGGHHHRKLVLSAVFFVLGFMLYATTMAAVGMVANSEQDSQMSVLWTAISVLPLLLFQPLSNSPDVWWVKAMSLFP